MQLQHIIIKALVLLEWLGSHSQDKLISTNISEFFLVSSYHFSYCLCILKIKAQFISQIISAKRKCQKIPISMQAVFKNHLLTSHPEKLLCQQKKVIIPLPPHAHFFSTLFHLFSVQTQISLQTSSVWQVIFLCMLFKYWFLVEQGGSNMALLSLSMTPSMSTQCT